MGESKSTGWSKASQRRKYRGPIVITPAAPEDKGREHEAEARTEREKD